MSSEDQKLIKIELLFSFVEGQMHKLLLAWMHSLTYTHIAQVLQQAAPPPELALIAQLRRNWGDYCQACLQLTITPFVQKNKIFPLNEFVSNGLLTYYTNDIKPQKPWNKFRSRS